MPMVLLRGLKFIGLCFYLLQREGKIYVTYISQLSQNRKKKRERRKKNILTKTSRGEKRLIIVIGVLQKITSPILKFLQHQIVLFVVE